VAIYREADASLNSTRGSWSSLLGHQAKFEPCDDGALAEGYSDAVVTLFAHKWDQFGAFVALSERHPAFQRWAIGHIDASASDEDLKRIVLNAGTCIDDSHTRSLCKTVQQAASNALIEIGQLQAER
jgi:hypothetical protein